MQTRSYPSDTWADDAPTAAAAALADLRAKLAPQPTRGRIAPIHLPKSRRPEPDPERMSDAALADLRGMIRSNVARAERRHHTPDRRSGRP
jgi:hypothetical protein